MPGLRTVWSAFWRDVEHPRLVRGAVLLFPLLALLVLLAACSPSPPVLLKL